MKRKSLEGFEQSDMTWLTLLKGPSSYLKRITGRENDRHRKRSWESIAINQVRDDGGLDQGRSWEAATSVK